MGREIFKWTYLATSCLYATVLIVAHSGAEYSEVRSMMQDEDKDKIHREETAWEKNLNKVVPDCLSYWNFLIAVVLLAAAGALFPL